MKILKSSGGRFISADEMNEIVPPNELSDMDARLRKVENDIKTLRK